jgi:hypothetical protein
MWMSGMPWIPSLKMYHQLGVHHPSFIAAVASLPRWASSAFQRLMNRVLPIEIDLE